MVTAHDVTAALDELGLHDEALCVHSSLRSFARVEGGADAVIDGVLAAGCTLLAPTFTEGYEMPAPPGERPARNGCDYAAMDATLPMSPRQFDTASTDLDVASMGAVPAAVLRRPDRARGAHALNSFAAVGPRAGDLIDAQSPLDVYGPLERLVEMDGFVVLMGVGLVRMTLIHLCEQWSGRNLLRRWALDEKGVRRVHVVGSCSRGFEKLAPTFEPIERRCRVGASAWRVFRAREAVALGARAIAADPALAACGRIECPRCPDLLAGGPLLQ